MNKRFVYIITALVLLTLLFISCDRSDYVIDSQGVDDDNDVVEIPAEIDNEEDDTYNSEELWTKITSIIGEKTPNYIDLNFCSDKYKYEHNRYIVEKNGVWLTITVDKNNNFTNAYGFSTAEDLITFDSLTKVSDKIWKVKMHSKIDTLQIKTASIVLKSSNIVYSGLSDNANRKMKMVGRLNNFLYGSNGWMVEYWKVRFGTQNRQFSQPIAITPEYIAKKGDILIWADSTRATICTDATTRVVNGIRENRFKMSAMNVRCKSEKTIKSMWTKSNAFRTTFKSAQESRGTPTHYQRTL